jgi:hypothetical protein
LGGTGGSGGGADGPLMGRSTCILTQHGSLFPERRAIFIALTKGQSARRYLEIVIIARAIKCADILEVQPEKSML